MSRIEDCGAVEAGRDLERLSRQVADYASNWRGDAHTCFLWADGPKGAWTPLEIRGWGYLTGAGHGALGLQSAQGRQIQQDVSDLVVEALNNLPSIFAEITRLRAENAHWKRQAEAAQNNATLFQQDCAFHVAEKARKDEALKPFADEAAHYDPDDGDGAQAAWCSDFTIASLRRARAARMLVTEGRAALSKASQAEGQTP